MAKPAFVNLWSQYLKTDDPCDGPWGNQCAIRMSIALNDEKSILVDKNTYSEPKCSHDHARGAESLANWLWKHQIARPKIYIDGAKGKIALQSKQGIIFFKDCFTRRGAYILKCTFSDFTSCKSLINNFILFVCFYKICSELPPDTV